MAMFGSFKVASPHNHQSRVWSLPYELLGTLEQCIVY